MQAYLKFGTSADQPTGSVEVPVRAKLLPWQEKGLRETASGYGRKLTTAYQVFWQGKWRRVYMCQFSNSGTAFIGKSNVWEAIVDFYF